MPAGVGAACESPCAGKEWEELEEPKKSWHTWVIRKKEDPVPWNGFGEVAWGQITKTCQRKRMLCLS